MSVRREVWCVFVVVVLSFIRIWLSEDSAKFTIDHLSGDPECCEHHACKPASNQKAILRTGRTSASTRPVLLVMVLVPNCNLFQYVFLEYVYRCKYVLPDGIFIWVNVCDRETHLADAMRIMRKFRYLSMV